MNYLSLFFRVVKEPSLANPALKVKNILHLDPAKLKASGIEFVVFDKDNTFTLTYKDEYFNEAMA